MKTLLKRAAALLFGAVFLAVLVFVLRGYRMYRDALDRQDLPDKVAEVRSNPSYTCLEELPPTYRNAVVAVEDHRFWQHGGIDPIAIARAAWNDLASRSLKEGGSTITQQLAKNLYFTQEKDFARKIAEVFMALRLEHSYTKEQILELYVNSIYFGAGHYCVRDACRGYFGKEPAEMTDYECTLLAGIPNAPSVYALTNNPELARQRQKNVVDNMIRYGYLTAEQGDVILASGS